MRIKFSANVLPLSWVIRLWTLSPVSHCEFIFSDGTSIYPAVETGHVILVRRKQYSWEYVYDIDITAEQEAQLRSWAEERIGVKYDFTALAPFNVLIPRKKKTWNEDNIWMCSEFCAAGLELLDIKLFDNTKKKVTPADLYKAVCKHSKFKLAEK